MANEYATVEELKTRLGIDLSDTSRDTELLGKLTGASRRIDGDTGRRFWLDDAATARKLGRTGRLVWTDDGERLLVPDNADGDAIVVEIGTGSSWTTVDTDRWEAGAYQPIADGWPVEWLLMLDDRWPVGRGQQIRVTATWGWPAVPEPIHDACLLLAQRLAGRKDSPEGVSTFADAGIIRMSRYDPDYEGNIADYIRAGA